MGRSFLIGSISLFLVEMEVCLIMLTFLPLFHFFLGTFQMLWVGKVSTAYTFIAYWAAECAEEASIGTTQLSGCVRWSHFLNCADATLTNMFLWSHKNVSDFLWCVLIGTEHLGISDLICRILLVVLLKEFTIVHPKAWEGGRENSQIVPSPSPGLLLPKFIKLNWLTKESEEAVLGWKQLFTAGSRKGDVQVWLHLCSPGKSIVLPHQCADPQRGSSEVTSTACIPLVCITSFSDQTHSKLNEDLPPFWRTTFHTWVWVLYWCLLFHICEYLNRHCFFHPLVLKCLRL